jgi:hypothetical protein
MTGRSSPNTAWPFGGAAVQIAASAESGLWLAVQRDLDRHRKFDQQFATRTYSRRGLPALHLPEPP